MGKAALIVIIVILALALVIGGVVVIPKLIGNDSGATFSTGSGANAHGLSFDENAGAYQAQTVVSKPGVTVPGWSSITIPANTTEVTVDFYNPTNNDGYYYMTFELKLADGESLYQSCLVRAGDHIQHITLSHGLAAGTYDAVVHVQPYTADDAMTATNNADMKLQLIVA